MSQFVLQKDYAHERTKSVIGRWRGHIMDIKTVACFAAFLSFIILFTSPTAMAEASSHASFCTSTSQGILPLDKRTSVSIKSFGVKGDGVTDDTEALQDAFDRVIPGTVLDFPTGTYLFSKTLHLRANHVVLRGKGGVLLATNADDQALEISGNKTAVIGLILQGVGGKRSTQPNTVKILLKGRWNQIIGTQIKGGASAGILVFGAHDFRIAGNNIENTLDADREAGIVRAKLSTVHGKDNERDKGRER